MLSTTVETISYGIGVMAHGGFRRKLTFVGLFGNDGFVPNIADRNWVADDPLSRLKLNPCYDRYWATSGRAASDAFQR